MQPKVSYYYCLDYKKCKTNIQSLKLVAYIAVVNFLCMPCEY